MNKSLFYPQDNGCVAHVIPAPNCGLTIEEIARKDVPAGKPYLIVDNSDVPNDVTFFEAWEADFSQPHGYGIGPNAWFIEKYQAEIATLDQENDAERIAQLNSMIEVQQAEMNA